MLTSGEFLLADQYGSRIQRDLAAAGHRARVLPDREWLQLSKGIRICSIANRNQDAMLLIDINGRLVINMNDSSDYGESFRVRRLAKNFKEVYMLQLHGWGGADMLNLFDPSGRKLVSIAEKRRPIAPRAQRAAAAMGANKFIPFSSFQRYSAETAPGPTISFPSSRITRPARCRTGRKSCLRLSGSTARQMRSGGSIRGAVL